MNKPDDISQEAWDAAFESCFRGNWRVVESVASAIMAAELRGEAREREACAQVADEEAARRFANSQAAQIGSWDFGPPDSAVLGQGHKAITAQSIAAAIRKRSDVNTAHKIKSEA